MLQDTIKNVTGFHCAVRNFLRIANLQRIPVDIGQERETHRFFLREPFVAGLDIWLDLKNSVEKLEENFPPDSDLARTLRAAATRKMWSLSGTLGRRHLRFSGHVNKLVNYTLWGHANIFLKESVNFLTSKSHDFRRFIRLRSCFPWDKELYFRHNLLPCQ